VVVQAFSVFDAVMKCGSLGLAAWLNFLCERGFMLHFLNEIKAKEAILINLLTPSSSTLSSAAPSSDEPDSSSLAYLYLYETIFTMLIDIANPASRVGDAGASAAASQYPNQYQHIDSSYGATVLLNLGAIRILSQCTYFDLQPDISMHIAGN
jgi:hypothetical protein